MLLFLQYLDGLVVGGVTAGAQAALTQVVFFPLTWTGPAVRLLTWSRDLAGGAMGGALVVAAITAVWPGLMRHAPSGPWSAILVRAALGAVVMGALPSFMTLLLTLNNTVLAALLQGSAAGAVHWSAGALLLSPLLALGLVGVLAGLVLYLSLWFVVRSVYVYWLAAWLPWAALGFVATGDPAVLWRPFRRLLAMVLVQTAQAAGWWITVRLVMEAASFGGLLVAAGGLWFLTRIPNEVARLGGERTLW
ncbi:MAG: hypothetical protein M0Z54_10410 [Thermaerobacter sp.]|nr:hypothetical protein [Thermaerobacter sp.]